MMMRMRMCGWCRRGRLMLGKYLDDYLLFRGATGGDYFRCHEHDPGFPDCWTGDPRISVYGSGGDDLVSGLGDYGTGPPDGNWDDESILDDPPPEEGLPPAEGGDDNFVLSDIGPEPWDGLVIDGGVGADEISGGSDNDVLIGGPGDDLISGEKSREFPGFEGGNGGAACLATYARRVSWSIR